MKGKFVKKRKRNPAVFIIILVVFLSLLFVPELISMIREKSAAQPETTPPVVTEPEGEPASTAPTETEPAEEPETVVETEPVQMQPINLGYDLILEEVGEYTGAYMEDGSDEIVSGIMMARIANTGDQDLQFCKVELTFENDKFLFEITDFPAGATVIALEKNRALMTDEVLSSASLENVAFFNEGMNIYADIFETSGASGMLNVKNISNSDISSDIYIHYKNYIGDIYYGGIAYRVKIEGGLKAGEIRQIMTGHYDPKNCTIVAIEYNAENDT